MGAFKGDLDSSTSHRIQLPFGSGHSCSVGLEFMHPWFSLKAAGAVLARAVLQWKLLIRMHVCAPLGAHNTDFNPPERK